MAWNSVGNIKGPPGQDGASGPGGALKYREVEFLTVGAHTFTPPAELLASGGEAHVLLVGGGGGGGSAGNTNATPNAGGGGGGGRVVKGVVKFTGAVNVVVGAGGAAGGSASVSAGQAGGASSIVGLLVAGGGNGGLSAVSSGAGVAGAGGGGSGSAGIGASNNNAAGGGGGGAGGSGADAVGATTYGLSPSDGASELQKSTTAGSGGYGAAVATGSLVRGGDGGVGVDGFGGGGGGGANTNTPSSCRRGMGKDGGAHGCDGWDGAASAAADNFGGGGGGGGASSDPAIRAGTAGGSGRVKIWWYEGARGTKGDPGATGPANTLSIGTVTGGGSASATITGTAPAQTLNLVLPKGDKGDKGDTGAPGATSWAGITDKPASFTPSAHTHALADLTSVGTVANGGVPVDSSSVMGNVGTLVRSFTFANIADWIRQRANSWTAVQTFKNIIFPGVANMGNVTGSININFTTGGQKVKATLVGNVTATVQLPGVGEYTFIPIQDGVGGRTLTVTGVRYWLGDGTAPAGSLVPLNTTANGRSFVKFFYDGDNLYVASAKCSP